MATASRPLDRVTQALIDKVAGDPTLSASVRAQARALGRVARTNPPLAKDRLDTLARRTAQSLPREGPTVDLCRAVPIETFRRYHASDRARAFLPDAQAVIDYLDNGRNQHRLTGILGRRDPLFPYDHCWLMPCDDIESLDGQGIQRVLALEDSPPYIVFRLSVATMVAAGVTVRPATSVDAVPGSFDSWSQSGLPTGLSELVDGDVPWAALVSTRYVE